MLSVEPVIHVKVCQGKVKNLNKFLLSEKLLLTTNPTEFSVAANVSDSLHTQKETV